MLAINSCVAMQVFVRNPNPEGNPPTIGLEVGPDTTVDDLARDIYNQYGRAYDLTLEGERLDAGSTLADAGVTAEAEMVGVRVYDFAGVYDLPLEGEWLDAGSTLAEAGVTAETELGAVPQLEDRMGGDPIFSWPPRREDAPSPSAPPQHELGRSRLQIAGQTKPSAPPQSGMIMVTVTKTPSAPPKPSVTRVTQTGIKA